MNWGCWWASIWVWLCRVSSAAIRQHRPRCSQALQMLFTPCPSGKLDLVSRSFVWIHQREQGDVLLASVVSKLSFPDSWKGQHLHVPNSFTPSRWLFSFFVSSRAEESHQHPAPSLWDVGLHCSHMHTSCAHALLLHRCTNLRSWCLPSTKAAKSSTDYTETSHDSHLLLLLFLNKVPGCCIFLGCMRFQLSSEWGNLTGSLLGLVPCLRPG